VDLSGWVGVGLGGNCDCRCGILYAPMLGHTSEILSIDLKMVHYNRNMLPTVY